MTENPRISDPAVGGRALLGGIVVGLDAEQPHRPVLEMVLAAGVETLIGRLRVGLGLDQVGRHPRAHVGAAFEALQRLLDLDRRRHCGEVPRRGGGRGRGLRPRPGQTLTLVSLPKMVRVALCVRPVRHGSAD
ncbi:hypothetical protein B4Q13_21225 [Lacticaseibacillus rhamnosus]